MSTSPTRIFCISDTHLGGDGEFGHCDVEEELIEFFRMVERVGREESCEVVIVGDFFGLWEIVCVDGVAKVRQVLEQYPRLFAQMQVTGKVVPITLVVGNHDYELVCCPDVGVLLAEYCITLERSVFVQRSVGGKVVWFEHGHQYDPANAVAEWGEPASMPPGAALTQQLVQQALRAHTLKGSGWFRDVQAVTPRSNLPNWMISNYFYQEVVPVFRYLMLLFLLIFNINVLLHLMTILKRLHVIPMGVVDRSILESATVVRRVLDMLFLFGVVGFSLTMLGVLIIHVFFRPVLRLAKEYGIRTVDFLAMVLLLLFSSKLRGVFWELVQRVKKQGMATLAREGRGVFDVQRKGFCLAAAEQVVCMHPDVAVIVLGHTHTPQLERLAAGQVVVNTGTWLKHLRRIRARSVFLPDVYYPFFLLSYAVVAVAEGEVMVALHTMPKHKKQRDLTPIQRFAILGRRKRVVLPKVRQMVVGESGREAT